MGTSRPGREEKAVIKEDNRGFCKEHSDSSDDFDIMENLNDWMSDFHCVGQLTTTVL